MHINYTTLRELRTVIKYKHSVFELPKTDNYAQSVIILLFLQASKRQALSCVIAGIMQIRLYCTDRMVLERT